MILGAVGAGAGVGAVGAGAGEDLLPPKHIVYYPGMLRPVLELVVILVLLEEPAGSTLSGPSMISEVITVGPAGTSGISTFRGAGWLEPPPPHMTLSLTMGCSDRIQLGDGLNLRG